MDIPESRPSAQHPTKSLFRARLCVGQKCQTVLMRQCFQWISEFRLFWQHIDISFCGWSWQKRRDIKPSCPHIKTGIVYPLRGERKQPGGWPLYRQNNPGCDLVTFNGMEIIPVHVGDLQYITVRMDGGGKQHGDSWCEAEHMLLYWRQ